MDRVVQYINKQAMPGEILHLLADVSHPKSLGYPPEYTLGEVLDKRIYDFKY